MDHVGIDLGKNQSQIAILTGAGELVERRICTDRERFRAVLGGNSPARILLEASTESEWVARCLEEMGNEVIVADPNYAPMYAQRSRKVKTDRRDARALAEACRLGAYRRAHRTSDSQRHVRAQLAVREAMVRTRTRYISLMRALIRREGFRVRSGNAETFNCRLRELELPVHLRDEVAPLVSVLASMEEQISLADETILRLSRTDDRIQRLCTAPGVGPITAASFMSSVDTHERFRHAHQLEAYLGLVPREWSSGETQHKGSITKVGNLQTRYLLVGAGWRILLSIRAEDAPLRVWGEHIAARRGKKVAVVALARRLAGILYAMMRDGSVYEHERLSRRGKQTVEQA